VERPRSYGRAWDGARRGSGAWPAALTGGDHGSAQNRGGRKREKRETIEREIKLIQIQIFLKKNPFDT